MFCCTLLLLLFCTSSCKQTSVVICSPQQIVKFLHVNPTTAILDMTGTQVSITIEIGAQFR